MSDDIISYIIPCKIEFIQYIFIELWQKEKRDVVQFEQPVHNPGKKEMERLTRVRKYGRIFFHIAWMGVKISKCREDIYSCNSPFPFPHHTMLNPSGMLTNPMPGLNIELGERGLKMHIMTANRSNNFFQDCGRLIELKPCCFRFLPITL